MTAVNVCSSGFPAGFFQGNPQANVEGYGLHTIPATHIMKRSLMWTGVLWHHAVGEYTLPA